MTLQKQKRNMNRSVRKFRDMLQTDTFFEKRFDIQEVQLANVDGIVYKRYVFIFKHPNGEVIKNETKWYNVFDVMRSTLSHGVFADYNTFIMNDMKWNGYDKVSALSEELITEYQEAYETLAK